MTRHARELRSTTTRDATRAGALLVAGVALAAGLSGCESSGGHSDGAMVAPVQDPIFYDIPKPRGFEPVYKNSRATASGTTRVAQVQYTGSLDRLKVKEFYEQHLPSAGFQPRHWSLDGGTFHLSFESDKEICEVKISPSGLKTVIDVALLPRHGDAAPREPMAQDPRTQGTGKARMSVDRAPPP